MKICMMSLMLGNAPIERILSVASSCGMGAIDWIGLHGRTPQELKHASDEAGIPIASHTMYHSTVGEPENFDAFCKALEAACIMEAKVLMLPPFPTADQRSMADDRKRYCEFYARALELSRKTPVTLTLESTGFVNSPVTTADETLELLRQLPDLRITFDPGNIATAEDPLEAFVKLRKYIVHIHLKDWVTSPVPKPGYELKRCGRYFADAMLGEGEMPWKKLWAVMLPGERELWVNPESRDYSGTMTPEEAFRKICRYLRSLPADQS